MSVYHKFTDSLCNGFASMAEVDRFLPPIADKLAIAIAAIPGVERVEIGRRTVSIYRVSKYHRKVVERAVSDAIRRIL